MKEFWKGLTPGTRKVVIAAITAVVVASMYFGVFEQLVDAIK